MTEILAPYNLHNLSEAALKKRLYISKGDKYNLPGEEPKHLRMGFAGLMKMK